MGDPDATRATATQKHTASPGGKGPSKSVSGQTTQLAANTINAAAGTAARRRWNLVCKGRGLLMPTGRESVSRPTILTPHPTLVPGAG